MSSSPQESTKSGPSRYAHLYRLGIVLAAAFVVFLGIVAVAMPASWHFDMGYWHRADALEEMKRQPLIYGGIDDLSASKRNEACKSCHEDTTKTVRKLKHKAVSCEACHAALFDHVQEGRKVAGSAIDRSTWQCLNCHEDFINKPEGFAQFTTTEDFKKHRDFKRGRFEPGTTCLKCHDAHDPTP
jgi:nitrate reductase cytochrome c-type subunit